MNFIAYLLIILSLINSPLMAMKATEDEEAVPSLSLLCARSIVQAYKTSSIIQSNLDKLTKEALQQVKECTDVHARLKMQAPLLHESIDFSGTHVAWCKDTLCCAGEDKILLSCNDGTSHIIRVPALSKILSIKTLKNQNIVAAAGSAGRIGIFDTTGKELKILEETSNNQNTPLAWLERGSILAYVFKDHMKVCLWNHKTQERHILKKDLDRDTSSGFYNSVIGLSWCEKRGILASLDRTNTISLWDHEGAVKTKICLDTDQFAIAWLQKNCLLACASQNGTITLLNHEGTFLRTLKSEKITENSCYKYKPFFPAIAWLETYEILASTCIDGSVKLWEKTGKLLKILPHCADDPFYKIQWLTKPSALLVTQSLKGFLEFWNLRGECLKRMDSQIGSTDHAGAVSCLGTHIMIACPGKKLTVYKTSDTKDEEIEKIDTKTSLDLYHTLDRKFS